MQQTGCSEAQVTNWLTYRRKKAKVELDNALDDPRGFIARYGYEVDADLLDIFSPPSPAPKYISEGAKALLGGLTGLPGRSIEGVFQSFQPRALDACEDDVSKPPDAYLGKEDSTSNPVNDSCVEGGPDLGQPPTTVHIHDPATSGRASPLPDEDIKLAVERCLRRFVGVESVTTLDAILGSGLGIFAIVTPETLSSTQLEQHLQDDVEFSSDQHRQARVSALPRSLGI